MRYRRAHSGTSEGVPRHCARVPPRASARSRSPGSHPCVLGGPRELSPGGRSRACRAAALPGGRAATGEPVALEPGSLRSGRARARSRPSSRARARASPSCASRASGWPAGRPRPERGCDVARDGLRISQRRLADRVRALYEQGKPEPLAVILGAETLDDAVSGVEHLTRIAEDDRQYILPGPERAEAADRRHGRARSARGREREPALGRRRGGRHAASRPSGAAVPDRLARRASRQQRAADLRARVDRALARLGRRRAGAGRHRSWRYPPAAPAC